MKRRGNSGVALLEVIIALTVFMLCVAGIAALILAAKEISDKARDHYTAANIAKNRLERAGIYARPGQLSQVFLMAVGDSNAPVDMSGADAPASSAPFRRTTTVSWKPGCTNLVMITVTVDIRNRRNLSFSGEKESLTSYLTELDMH